VQQVQRARAAQGRSIISPDRWRWRATSPSKPWPATRLARQDWIYDWRV